MNSIQLEIIFVLYYLYKRMDTARQLLDNLMGRDRNKPKGDAGSRDHYSNRDVCKPYLICFCFHTLFPNTVFDQGPCNKRHDTYLKTMFDNDLGRQNYQKQYIKQCINWIQRRLQDVNQKIKKNQNVIDTKSTFTGDRPKGILDRIFAIQEQIVDLTKQSQIFGENGQIDESARCLEQVERLRQRRREIQSMNDTNNSVIKQQKICEICGAIQTIGDTQKRIQTHLQGKIHQGFLKLRHQVETLRIRLEMLHKMDNQNKKAEIQQEQNKQLSQAKIDENNDKKSRQKDSKRSRSHRKKKEKDRHRSREKEKKHKKHKDRDDHDRYNEDDRKHSKKKHKRDHSKSRDHRRSRSRDKHSKDNYYR